MERFAKEVVKLGLNVLQGAYVSAAKATSIIDFPVPANSSLRKTSSKTIRHYYVSGIRCYLPIATMALHYKINLTSNIRILDFGCGVARELLHFVRHYPQPKYFACDIDVTSVAFVKKNFPHVETYHNEFKPPLRYASAMMDMTYSVSTFSHLSPEDQGPWLEELCRITKPGGYCFLTTEGLTAFRMMSDVFGGPKCEQELRTKGVLYKEYYFMEEERQRKFRIPIVSATMGIDGTYGNTVLTPEYIRRTWVQSGFEVVDVIEGIIDHRQDLVVLRRPT